ncbi:hypothetical protein JCM3766R1_005656 [Sporobolomyces carnicolor]
MAESSEWVTLISDDGFRFVLPRSAALGSGLVQDALTSDFAEASSNTVSLPEQRPEIVEKVAEYLMYKERYSHSKENVPDFKDRVKPETALELLMISDYMNC